MAERRFIPLEIRHALSVSASRLEMRFLMGLFLTGFLAALILPFFALATDFTSGSFKVKDPVIDNGGVVNSSSDSFRLTGVISQIAIGTSSGSTLQVKSGFLYFSAAAAAAAAAAPAPQSPGGNFSFYLESLAKSLSLPIIPLIKPGLISFDLNGDNKVDLKDLSAFLTVTPLTPANRMEFNKNLSVFLYYWTSPIFSFFEKQTPQSGAAPQAPQFKTPSFFKENVAAIFSLKKESIATPSAPEQAPPGGKEKQPGIIKTAVQFISNIFSRIIKIFKK